MSLILTPLPEIPLIKPGDDLVRLLLSSLQKSNIQLVDGDIIVLAQKIVSKAEGRFVNLEDVVPSRAALEYAQKVDKDARLVELILRESKTVLRCRPGTIIVEHKHGFICANAGIDHSNVNGLDRNPDNWYLLLPVDPDASARSIRAGLETASGCHLGVMIIDSHGRAWRLGVVGISIGLAGMPGLVDQRGWEDLLGYHLKVTQVAAADELAAAASLVMGQAAEGTPAVHVRGFPYPLREGGLRELIRPIEQDLFR